MTTARAASTSAQASIPALRECMEAVAGSLWEQLQSAPGSELRYYRGDVEGIDGALTAQSIQSDSVMLFLLEDGRGDTWEVFWSALCARLAHRRIDPHESPDSLVREFQAILAEDSAEAGWQTVSVRPH